jgi:hypothetical protein
MIEADLRTAGAEATEERPMTEAEWLACENSGAMLEFIQGKASDRKDLLLDVACCRAIWHLLRDERNREMIRTLERIVDGPEGFGLLGENVDFRNARRAARIARVELWQAAKAKMEEARGEVSQSVREAYTVAAAAEVADFAGLKGNLAYWVDLYYCGVYEEQSTRLRCDAHEEVRRGQSDLIRDIYGNPFRTVVFDPRWRTSDTIGVAQAIYEDRAFGRLPILADALMDAGCDDEQVVSHCRGDGPHVRGCWVVDLVLGKE